jgi:hypothetical protein
VSIFANICLQIMILPLNRNHHQKVTTINFHITVCYDLFCFRINSNFDSRLVIINNFKLTLVKIILQNSAHTSKKTHFTITKINW